MRRSTVALVPVGMALGLGAEWAAWDGDGLGGADASRGSGLRGLADRVEALGGRLQMESRRGAGTRIVAELPLDR